MGTLTDRRRAVVTGADGFIGGHLVNRLTELGYDVKGVDLKGLLGRDLRRIDDALDAVAGADWVFHLASDMGGVGYFHAHDYTPFINNMRIDMNVLEACERKGVKRLFYASSACIYPTHLQMTEGEPPKLSEDMIYPARCDQMYGWEKLMGLRLAERAPLDERVGILHTVYGPGQEWESERAKFPPSVAAKALNSKATGEPLKLWGNGRQMRSYLYVDDAIERIIAVMESDTYDGPVNIGAEGAVSCEYVARLCLEVLEANDIPLIFTDDGPSGVLARDCDSTKYRRLYRNVEGVSLRDGFRSLMEWIGTQWREVA